jgi:hypothetical protein
MEMERGDSNPSIEALIKAHEGIVDHTIANDGEDDDTPRPSAIVQPAQQGPRPDSTAMVTSSNALPHTDARASAVPSLDASTFPNAVPPLSLDGPHANFRPAAECIGLSPAPDTFYSSSPTAAPSPNTPRSPSAKTSLHSIPLSKSRSFSTSTLAARSGVPLSTPFPYISHRHVHSLNKFVLYETKRRFYIVGTNTSELLHRVLKIDRTSPQEELNIIEDKTVYSEKQLKQLLSMLDDGNRHTGGFTRAGVFFGIAGGALRV